MSQRVREKSNDGDPLEKVLGGLRDDGTHPDFPVKKFVNLADWTRLPWSELAFDLPALVVYGLDSPGEPPAVGVVFALSHSVDGTQILAVSRYSGETRCHSAGLSPAGRPPAYLLVKRHLPPAGAP